MGHTALAVWSSTNFASPSSLRLELVWLDQLWSEKGWKRKRLEIVDNFFIKKCWSTFLLCADSGVFFTPPFGRGTDPLGGILEHMRFQDTSQWWPKSCHCNC
uniref:Uncharacterized protein n=1 Tax=Rhizoctonia solani TaxID=456999 RepID=N0ACP4_9AGAM|nr:hypothetical protein RSOL_m00090 [Rhizoctonia solani]AGK45352.1 hypothetical protein RSOL_m00090 [Rhizoctonia solani]